MNVSVSVTKQEARQLSTTKAGEMVRLVQINAGRGLNSRLAAMGLVAGTELRVVSNGHPGPFVLIVKEAKVVLGRGVAQKIWVV
jgi:Fe2+ transport system protein FeoA